MDSCWRSTSNNIFLYRLLSIFIILTSYFSAIPQSSVHGELIFTDRLHEARVYHGAPAGLYVTTVRATQNSESSSESIMDDVGNLSKSFNHITYKLLRGGSEFIVDEKNGRITTRQKVTKAIGEVYALLVVAINGGETESLQEEVRVIRYNRYSPWFTLPIYRLEIPHNAPIGTNLMLVEAKDNDKESYNAEVYYYLRPKGKNGGDIGPHTKTNDSRENFDEDDKEDDDENNTVLGDFSRYFYIDPRSGILSLRRSLKSKITNLIFDVVAIDGGSPHRWNVTTLEVSVKTITEPLDVQVDNATVTGVRVCWRRPQSGFLQGYLVRYRETWRDESESYNGTSLFLREDTLNMTVEQSTNRHCVHLRNLHPNSAFELRAYGWNGGEVGLGSKILFFSTAKPRCPSENVCGANGSCHILIDHDYSAPSAVPNYNCECDNGFYGFHCENYNPCSSAPCQNLATCNNVSNLVYECICVDGFYGLDCSEFNPCASTDVVACHNDGVCHSGGSHMYECLCRNGYFGRGCERFDPCQIIPRPCLNGALCHNVSDFDVTCDCVSGFKGKFCEENIDDCTSSSCLNGATCQDGIHSFSCVCQPGYKGALCQEEINECESSPCLNGGSCEDRVNAFNCICPLGYEGHRCEVDIDDCSSNPCLNGALCRDGPAMSFTCLCANGYEGILCNDIMTCMPETLHLSIGDLRYNSTPHGHIVTLPCPHGPENALATRRCVLYENSTVEWMALNVTSCREVGFTMAMSLTDHLRLFTSNPSTLNASQLSKVVDHLEIVLDYAITDRKIANEMVRVISNVLDANETAFTPRNENATSTRLYNVLDRFVNEVQLHKQNMTITTSNVRIAISKMKPSGIGNHFPIREMPLKGMAPKLTWDMDKRLLRSNAEDNKIDDDSPIVNVSPEIFYLVPDTINETRLQFVAYRNSKLFMESSDLPLDRYTPVDHPVFSLSVANVTIQNMSQAVNFTVKKPLYGSWICVFWDDSRDGRWSKDGLSRQQNDDEITCSSNHMTAFSVLLDPDPESLETIHLKSMSIISYIGSGLSMIGLSLTIITYSLFRCLNRDKSGKILLNLCVSMLLMNVAFLAGSLEPKTNGYGSPSGIEVASDLCRIVAVLIHYFLLTTLSWMTVEAANMYQLLIHVFATSETKFMLKRCIIAWGLPLVIVGTTAAINVKFYDSRNEYCMLSPANPYVYYATYVGPSCLLLLVNVIVFILVTRVLFQPRGVTSSPARIQHKPPGRFHVLITFAQVRGSFTVMTLLGITWVFGVLAIGPTRVVFQYVFCVLNSLQGFLVFVVKCLQYPEARSAWVMFLMTGTLKKHRGTKMTTSTNSNLKLSLSGGTASGGGVVSNGTLNMTTNSRDRRKNSNLSADAAFPSQPSNNNPSGFDTQSWVYGGRSLLQPQPNTMVVVDPMASKMRTIDENSIIKNRSSRQLIPSNTGFIAFNANGTLDTKEGRDTHWQYLNLNGNLSSKKRDRHPKCSYWVPHTDPVQLTADDTYDVPFMEDVVETRTPVGINDEKTKTRKTGLRNVSQCDQGYSSAEQSPNAKRITILAAHQEVASVNSSEAVTPQSDTKHLNEETTRGSSWIPDPASTLD